MNTRVCAGWLALLVCMSCNSGSARSGSSPTHTVKVGTSGEPLISPAPTSARSADSRALWPSNFRDGVLMWTPYSSEVMARAKSNGRPALVRIDAQWDLNGMVLLKTIFKDRSVLRVFEQTQILAVHLDMTDESRQADALLAEMGRDGIPAYMVVLPEGEPLLIPINFDDEQLLDALYRAAKRFPAPPHK